MMKIFIGVPVIVLLLIGSVFSPVSGTREECVICGMWIDQHMATRHEIHAGHGRSASFCSLACAARYWEEHRKEVEEIRVADYLTHALTDAKEAYYLEGSDIPGVMSYTSRIAFSRREEAEEFRKRHGGKVISFREALNNQLGG